METSGIKWVKTGSFNYTAWYRHVEETAMFPLNGSFASAEFHYGLK